MRLFRRRKKNEAPKEPICVHEWYLIDTKVTTLYNGFDIEFADHYEVGCPKCNGTKVMDSKEFNHFRKVFKIRNMPEEESHES